MAKGYKDLTEAYNKWIDRYNEIYCELNELDKVNVEEETLKLEQERLQFEIDKFNYEAETKKKDDIRNSVFSGVEIGAKVGISILMVLGTMALGKLAYEKDLDLSLCNGRIWSLKDVFKLATMKI
jgi:hypothetical protein